MEEKSVAVLFVDICGYTAFCDRHGEKAGRERVERCFRVVVPEIESRKGRVLKYMGDGFLSVFATASDLVTGVSAAYTQLAAANDPQPPESRVRLHSGGDFGSAIFDQVTGDVFGDVANTAARVQALAGPDQIYATEDLVRVLPMEERLMVRPVGSFPLRGKQEEVAIYEIQWRLEGSTMLVSRAALRIESRLRLASGGQVIEFRPDQARLTIGRIPGNDLVVEDAAVSREHAEVIRRRGFFYLVDRSTNGTYLYPAGGKDRHLHREEIHLEGSGHFSLGRPDGPPVEYSVI